MRPGAVLLNFARDGVVDDAAVVAALRGEAAACYVCDFPGAALLRQPRRDRAAAPGRVDRARPRRTAR